MPPKERKPRSTPPETPPASPGSTDPELARRILAEHLKSQTEAANDQIPNSRRRALPASGRGRRRTDTPPPDPAEQAAADQEFKHWQKFKELEQPTEKPKNKPKGKKK